MCFYKIFKIGNGALLKGIISVDRLCQLRSKIYWNGKIKDNCLHENKKYENCTVQE